MYIGNKRFTNMYAKVFKYKLNLKKILFYFVIKKFIKKNSLYQN